MTARDIVKLPNGTTITAHAGEGAAFQALVDRRHAIAMAHCRANGWPEDPDRLTLGQIMQIRALPEWIEAKP